MTSFLYRALNAKETERIKTEERSYLGTKKKIGNLSPEEIKEAYQLINRHVVYGNKFKNDSVFSITGEFLAAIKFATPSIVMTDNQVKHVKVHRSIIAVFNEEIIENRILDVAKIPEYDNGKKFGATAHNYAYSNDELFFTGRIDEDEFYILEKFHQDLLFCCYEKEEGNTEDVFLEILNVLSKSENRKNISKLYKKDTYLTNIEKLVYYLIYCKNLNLYEIVAPVYYSEKNQYANIYCIYDAVLEILHSIIKKTYDFLEVRSPANINIHKKLLDLYTTEFNVLCIRTENDKYIKSIDFSALFDEYNINITSDFRDLDYIWEISLEPNKYGSIGCNINASPLFLYLPKNLNMEVNQWNHNLLGLRERDYYFQESSTKKLFKESEYERPKERFSCEIRLNKYGEIVKKVDDKPYSVYFNLSILCSELYIPPNYTSLDENFFALEYLGEECFNFYNSSINTHGMKKNRYNEKRRELLHFHRKLLYSYVDRLVKVFGGRNLEDADFNSCLNKRVNDRSCKDRIIFNRT